jgi:hypothetical protein
MVQHEDNSVHKDEHGNKHVKVAVKYPGTPGFFEHNYLPTDKVLSVKDEAMTHFKISAPRDTYCIQYEDTILNDALTLSEAGFQSENERVEVILSTKEKNDTDGGQ